MKSPGLWSVAWSAILLLSSGLEVAAAASTSRLSGSATYREKIALSPTARFEATLEDVSRPESPEVVSSVRMENIGQPPIKFKIEYDKSDIIKSRPYVVRATIRDHGDQLLFTSSKPVLTQGHGSKASILLSLVPDGGRRPTLAPLPASFTGVLPCADCKGIQYLINLLEDGAFMQRTTYLRESRDESVYEIGAWSLASDQRTLMLSGGGSNAYWSLKSSNTLRKLDQNGRDIVSNLPYELKRAPQPLEMEPRVRLRGLFQYVAKVARFSDCASGLQWTVAREGDYADLERAYAAQKKKKKSDADLFVTLDGRVAMSARSEPTLVVENFVRASPSGICMESAVQLELPNNRWRPTVVAGKPVVLSGQQKEPWIVLDPKLSKVSGYSGCNRVSGSYRAGNGGRLKFSQLAATGMPCQQSAIERSFFDALERTMSYRIVGRNLELYGSDGTMVARLEERNL